MFVYSVKFICGTQNVPSTAPNICTPVRQGVYATEINIHNFQATAATIQKRALLLVHNDQAVREPAIARAQPFANITLPPDTATMDDCCSLQGPLNLSLTQLNIGFLEILSNVALNVTAVYTATDSKAPPASISIDVQSIAPQQV